MFSPNAKPGLRVLLLAICLTLMGSVLVTSPAFAHAELRQSSPEGGETVGGAVHSIALQFFDLDVSKPPTAQIFDAAGNELPGQVNREDQRLVIALIDPITTPGEYLVTYDMTGVDGDYTEESFTFRWEEGAPEPKGITADLTVPVGFDTVNYVLLLVGAALAGYLVHRVLAVRREMRADQLAVNDTTG